MLRRDPEYMVYFCKWVGGTLTIPSYYDFSYPPVDRYMNLTVVWRPDNTTLQHECWINGTRIYAITDGSYTAPGYFGFSRPYNSYTTSFDNLTVRSGFTAAPPVPVAAFTANTSSGTQPLAVQFSDTSSVLNPTGWYWDFGDEGTSTSQHPLHIYTSSGVFDVRHSVTNASGTGWENRTAYIIVTEPSPPPATTLTDTWSSDSRTAWSGDTAYFNWSPQGCLNLTTEARQIWNNTVVGNGTYTIFVRIDPAVPTFESFDLFMYGSTAQDTGDPEVGSNRYGVMLRRDPEYMVYFCKWTGGTLTIPSYYDFSYPPVDRYMNLTVVWRPDNTTLQHECWINGTRIYAITDGSYTDPGYFGLSRPYNSYTTSFDNMTVTSGAAAVPPAPVAAFTANATSGPVPLPVQFTDTSSVLNPTSWYWDFGDTTGDTAQHPVHTYTTEGAYDVRHSVTNASGTDWENKTAYITAGNVSASLLTLFSPFDDTVTLGNITVAGNVSDPEIANVTVAVNGVNTSLPVTGCNFSTVMNITTPATLVVSAPGTGPVTVFLDGDYLPASTEDELGFDPLDPDSDCTSTGANEADNSIPDGFEILNAAGNETLPVFVKARIGGDPNKVDTDDDGLTDAFELLRLGLITDVRTNNTDGSGLSDAEEDIDSDGLTNLEEQAYGTDPLVNDTDHDSILDEMELALGTNASAADSDHDLLTDDSELRLGTNPLVGDSNTNGIPDGNETYTTVAADETLGVAVAVTGTGDLAKDLTITNITSPAFVNTSFLAGPVIDVYLNGSFQDAGITLPYDPESVENPENLSVYYFNETVRTFVPVQSEVNLTAHCVSANVTHFSTYTVLPASAWNSFYGTGPYNTILNVDLHIAMSPTLEDHDPDGSWKTANKNFIDALNMNDYDTGDWVGLSYFNGTSLNGVGFSCYDWYIDPLIDDPQSLYPFNYGPGRNYHLGLYPWAPSQGVDPKRVIILLMDGPGINYQENDLNASKALNATYYTIALVDDTDADLLQYIADETGGRYYFASSPEDLPAIYQEIAEICRPEIEFGIGTDTDHDGLPDLLEVNGFVDGRGQIYYTLPNNDDTDGDGLKDGEEAGQLITVDGRAFYEMWSDPSTPDTETDGLNDYDEKNQETDAFDSDSDHDLLPDGIDDNPSVPFYISAPLNDLIMKRDSTAGMVFGETGINGGSMNWLVTDAIASTPAYFVGWMASGYYVAGDIRDTIEALYQHDNVGAGLNAIGIVPFAGDGERTMNALRKVTTKYPGRAVELCQFLIKQDVIQRIPYESVKIWILDLCHSNGATELLGANIPIERIYAVAGDGINLHRHFEGLLKIINSGRSVSDKVGSAAEIIASEGVLKSEFPETLYTIYNNVKLIGYNSREIGEIDHVIVEKASGNVIAIIQTKQTQRKLEDALRQLSANRITINDLTGFIETSVGAALTPEKFRAVTVSELKVGPNEGIGFDYVVEYTSKELDALWHTLWFG